MNYKDKLQKFSIRKYAIGTFSTVIATLIFLGANLNQAKADETINEQLKAKMTEQKEATTEDNNSNLMNSPTLDDSLNNQSDSTEQKDSQSEVAETSSNAKESVQQSSLKNNTQDQTNSATKPNEKNAADNSTKDNKDQLSEITHDIQLNHQLLDDKNNNSKLLPHIDTTKDSKHKYQDDSLTTKVVTTKKEIEHKEQIDKNKLQALYDASYHDYRMIDKDKADKTLFNKVKTAFDEVNNLLAESNPTEERLNFGYDILQQALAEARTLPQRTIKSNNKRITRSEDRDVSSNNFQNAMTEYYVSNENDGSGYPPGTFLHASIKNAPWRLPVAGYTLLKAGDVSSLAHVSAVREKDGYRWTIDFNAGHNVNEDMIYWFGLPDGQTPTGPASITFIDTDGSQTSSLGTGSDAGKPLNRMWDSSNYNSAFSFKHGPAHNYTFYSNETMTINSYHNFVRGKEGDRTTYFYREGATEEAKRNGDRIYRLLNGDTDEIYGIDQIYAFKSKGDKAYRIEFRTTGDPQNRFYYAAGAVGFEYNSLYNFNQEYVEPYEVFQQRIKSLLDIKNRTYHLGNVERVKTKEFGTIPEHLLDGVGSVKEYAEDPESFVVNPSSKLEGFANPNTPRGKRIFGVDALNHPEVMSQFSDDKLQEAARTGQPIHLAILFNVQDKDGNPETVKDVYLYVKPEIQYNIGLFNNDQSNETDNNDTSRRAGHSVFEFMNGPLHNTANGNSYNQEVRIRLQSNEPIKDTDWSIVGLPSGVSVEPAKGRTNFPTEKNLALVGNLPPGDFFITVRFGKNEKQFEVRSKPNPPRITTTVDELKGKGGQRPDITITDLPHDYKAKVLLVTEGQDGGQQSNNMATDNPKNYRILAEAHSNENGQVTLTADNYKTDLPLRGEIRAITYYTKNVLSNFSNTVQILRDDIAPQISEPTNMKNKYYRTDRVSLKVNVSDEANGFGLNTATVENLPHNWTQRFVKNSDGRTGTLTIEGTIDMSQPYNSQIALNIKAVDNANNTQNKTIRLSVGKLSQDMPATGLENGNKIVVVNPSILTGEEKAALKYRISTKNSNIRPYLDTSYGYVVQLNGIVQVNYKDNSQLNISQD